MDRWMDGEAELRARDRLKLDERLVSRTNDRCRLDRGKISIYRGSVSLV